MFKSHILVWALTIELKQKMISKKKKKRSRLASSLNFKGSKYVSQFLWILEMIRNEAKMNSHTSSKNIWFL